VSERTLKNVLGTGSTERQRRPGRRLVHLVHVVEEVGGLGQNFPVEIADCQRLLDALGLVVLGDAPRHVVAVRLELLFVSGHVSPPVRSRGR
jgi:hypothetical protein